MQVIPAIDLIDGCCVRLYQGDYDRKTQYGREPLVQALAFAEAGFPWLHLIDLDGADTGRLENRQVILQIVSETELSIQVGGGIRRASDVQALLDAGVARLIIGTVALQEPERWQRWLNRWGPGRFVLSLDLKEGQLQTHGWRRRSATSLETALDLLGTWEIPTVICTDVQRDGTMQQPNFDLYRSLLSALKPGTRLLAAGGISRPADVSRLSQTGVHGAVVGRALYEGRFDLRDWLNVG